MIAPQRTRRAGLRAAFTLMEMLVVVAIIVMLAGLGGVYFINSQRNSQKKAAEIQIRTLTQACEQFSVNNLTQYPTDLTDLLNPNIPGGPYLKMADALVDPWGQRYQYQFPGPHNGNVQPDIYTTAPDGEIIGNWSKLQF